MQILPGKPQGTIMAPVSKSMFQRAVAAALLAKGTSYIYNPGDSEDCLASLDMAANLGATLQHKPGLVEITSNGVFPITDQLSCGESGLAVRMFTPIAALSAKKLVISGTGSLMLRPMHFFEEILPQLGVHCQTSEGKLPVYIQGPVNKKDITMDGSMSSQFLTGILMALAGNGKGGTITVTNLVSKPYIDITINVLNAFGVHVKHMHYEQFHIAPGAVQPASIQVEGDWSGAAFLLVAAAINGVVIINGVQSDSCQPDRKILEALALAGIQPEYLEDGIKITAAPLQAFSFDATDCPDLFPPLLVLAAYAPGISRISGVHRLLHKESNRALSLFTELSNMGMQSEITGDVWMIEGGKPLSGTHTDAHGDHRVTMACAIAALGATGATMLEHAEAIGKSYPGFFLDLQRLNIQVIKA